MTKNILIILVLLLFSSEIVKGQTEVYLDTNFLEVSKEQFNSKAQHSLINNRVVYTDTSIIHKLVYRYSMGTLDSVTNKQIRTLLSKDSGGYAPVDAPIYLHYMRAYDTNKGQNNSKKIRLENRAKHTSYRIKKRDTAYSRKRDRLLPKIRKTIFRKMANCAAAIASGSKGRAIFMYGQDQSNAIDKKVPHFLKDRGIIKRLFFKYEAHSYFIAIHPNGDYLQTYFLPDDKILQLLNMKDWSPIMRDLNESMELNRLVGFFNFDRYIGECSHEG